MDNTDCKVCQKLIKEKHRNMIWWKVGCIIFAALAIVLGILYFGSGAVVTTEEVRIERNNIENGGDNGTVIINGNQVTDSYNGVVEHKDYTPIICISVVACVAILIVGGVLIANHSKKDL